MTPIPFVPHLRFGQCVSRRYQVFSNVRYEKVLSIAKAYDLVGNKPVYVFSLPQALFIDFPQARAHLRLHVTQMRQLNNPLLLNILSSGETEDLFVFVEEHPEGKSLGNVFRERRQRNEPFSDQEALGLCWLLCRALKEVQKVTVHGFIHPLDIYLEPWSGGPIPFYPKVAHIGIRAMLRAVRMSFEGLDEETACYAAPDFVAYGTLQKQVDVYGIGAILYALLTGRPPTGCFVRPSSVRLGLPKMLDQILLCALDEEPGERYASPAAFARALESVWPLGIYRRQMEEGAIKLCGAEGEEGGMEPAPIVIREPERRWTRADALPVGGPAAEGALSALLSDKVRAVCMVLLMLLNLGLFCQAAMEAGSSRRKDLSGSRELSRWESMFSASGLESLRGPDGTG